MEWHAACVKHMFLTQSARHSPVSYTHLDVYKRQQIMHIFVNSTVSVLAIMLKLLHQKSKTDLQCSPPRTLLSPFDTWPVSYTHLDVYKRQILSCGTSSRTARSLICRTDSSPVTYRTERVRLTSPHSCSRMVDLPMPGSPPIRCV